MPGLLLTGVATAAVAAPHESKAATAGFARLGQTLLGGAGGTLGRTRRGSRCSDPPLRRRRRWMDLPRAAAVGSATAAAAAPLDRKTAAARGGNPLLLRLLLVQRQSPPVLVAQSSTCTGLRHAPWTVAETKLMRLRLPLLEEVLTLGTTTGRRLSDRLLLWNGCGICNQSDAIGLRRFVRCELS